MTHDDTRFPLREMPVPFIAAIGRAQAALENDWTIAGVVVVRDAELQIIFAPNLDVDDCARITNAVAHL